MEIDLLKTKIYLVSTGEGKYRERLRINIMRLVDRGFTRIEYVKSVPDESITNSLSKTQLQIMDGEAEGTEPFMILEDDIDIRHFIRHLTVPRDASAVYLGVSLNVYPHAFETVGRGFGIRNVQPSDLSPCEANDDLVRIKGILTTHAILFMDRAFTRMVASRIREHLEKGLMQHVWHDIIMGSCQLEYPIYALKDIMFYQSREFGGREEDTLVHWDENVYRAEMPVSQEEL